MHRALENYLMSIWYEFILHEINFFIEEMHLDFLGASAVSGLFNIEDTEDVIYHTELTKLEINRLKLTIKWMF